ncbi:MAG: GntR family transcriptional regulator [Chthoniobacter sp.]|uniref:GntR family transcriptional regulator n=1 Tax=Chthoniobacter sp. TaxID=2510640 RepID=UPI0032AE072A
MSLAIHRPSLVEQAAEALRQALQERTWIGRMPGERELSRQLNISRPTLRAALELLRAEGRLKVSPGRQRVIVKRAGGGAPLRLRTVGVLTPLPLQEIPPFALCWMDRLRELLAQAGLQLEIHSGRRWYSRRPEKDLAALTEQAPAGAWLLFMTNERMQRWFVESKLPAVLSGSGHPGIELPSVDFDYRAVCRHAAGQFLRRGHRRIVLLMQASDTAGDRESEAGFLEAFQTRAGAAANAIVAHHDGTPESIRQRLHGLLGVAAAPTAFLVARSMPALMTASELLRRGLHVPSDAAVIARDSDHFHEYFSPQLARYRADPEMHARRLSRILIHLIGEALHRSNRIRIMPKFFPGESLGEMRRSS